MRSAMLRRLLVPALLPEIHAVLLACGAAVHGPPIDGVGQKGGRVVGLPPRIRRVETAAPVLAVRAVLP